MRHDRPVVLYMHACLHGIVFAHGIRKWFRPCHAVFWPSNSTVSCTFIVYAHGLDTWSAFIVYV